jgi:hypothetical protein
MSAIPPLSRMPGPQARSWPSMAGSTASAMVFFEISTSVPLVSMRLPKFTGSPDFPMIALKKLVFETRLSTLLEPAEKSYIDCPRKTAALSW